MQLLLLIIGVVLAGYVVFTLLRGRKKSQRIEEFDHTLFENPNAVHGKTDPLLEDYQEKVVSHRHPITEIDKMSISMEVTEFPAERQGSYTTKSFENTVSSQPTLYIEEEYNYIEEGEPAPASAVEDFIAFTILPKQREGFPGDTLLAALKVNYFQYGKHNIFHRHEGDDPHEKILFSLASMVEPGYFDLATMMNGSHYSGVLIFMTLPCDDPLGTFEKMFTTSRQSAATLNGELCDEKRKHLTIQMLTKYRDRIRQASGYLQTQQA